MSLHGTARCFHSLSVWSRPTCGHSFDRHSLRSPPSTTTARSRFPPARSSVSRAVAPVSVKSVIASSLFLFIPARWVKGQSIWSLPYRCQCASHLRLSLRRA
ncbi:hypothetical protein JCGZ_14874 [Jatropha curcas]|uniref:Uncharacterized protein n=1 Tax=Jatropha curcas TaxID=180498 RepID=A0A067KK48_JATCU|nr:hypothetical protein JCGZ_14874 [Jatropha curcas]